MNDRKEPPIGRQILYGIIIAVICFVMVGLVFYCIGGGWNPFYTFPLLLMMAGAQTIGRIQEIDTQRKREKQQKA
jgi:hypothetical protein